MSEFRAEAKGKRFTYTEYLSKVGHLVTITK
jgi:hypothetical protein